MRAAWGCRTRVAAARSGRFSGPTVELRHTAYDVEAAAAAIREAGGTTYEQQAGYLLDPPDPDEVSAYFESQRV